MAICKHDPVPRKDITFHSKRCPDTSDARQNAYVRVHAGCFTGVSVHEVEVMSDEEDVWSESDDLEEMVSVPCALCDQELIGVDAVWAHCSSSHRFDLTLVTKQLGLDYHGYVRLVNFLRRNKADFVQDPPSDWGLYLQGQSATIADDRYLIPVIPDDPLLVLVPDALLDDEDVPFQCFQADLREPPSAVSLLERRLRAAEERAELAESALAEARTLIRSLVLDSDEPKDDRQISSPIDMDRRGYFEHYSQPWIHLEMLQDTVRTNSYRDFLVCNRSLFADKVVADLGCGTGILSLFAATAGSSQVLAIDNSDVVLLAEANVHENALNSVVTVLRGKIEDIDLGPCVKHVDIILSEWMGYFLLYESMLDSVIMFRDRWLKPGGRMVPDQCEMYVLACNDKSYYDRHVTYWHDVYGFRMGAMMTRQVKEACVDMMDATTMVSKPASVRILDLLSITTDQLEFTSRFCLEISASTTVYCLVGYFDVRLGGPDGDGGIHAVSFSTGPEAPYTHWKQTVFLLARPFEVVRGDTVRGSMSVIKSCNDNRALIVTIEIDISEGVTLQQTFSLS